MRSQVACGKEAIVHDAQVSDPNSAGGGCGAAVLQGRNRVWRHQSIVFRLQPHPLRRVPRRLSGAPADQQLSLSYVLDYLGLR